ncbi:MAG TPA: hypothetical protein ENJ90_07015 [Devosia sp.]|nr:hypothetical protein [Devosia sp.]
MRFGALRRAIPEVTRCMLALRELEADGLVFRDVRQVVPPHVEYSLARLGEEVRPVLNSLQALACLFQGGYRTKCNSPGFWRHAQPVSAWRLLRTGRGNAPRSLHGTSNVSEAQKLS